jgi:hypothetical protein
MDRCLKPESIRQAAANGFNLLLGQNGSPDLVAEIIGITAKRWKRKTEPVTR